MKRKLLVAAVLACMAMCALEFRKSVQDTQYQVATLEGQLNSITDRTAVVAGLDSIGVITDGLGFGSCVAIEPNMVLTAGHCISHDGAYVEIAGQRYEILNEWRDDEYDVGFVVIDGLITPLELGEMPSVLDEVYLVGSPYCIELSNTITKGIVSHLSRDVFDWIDLIQADAEGAFGSSGGPLLDVSGRVIGICVAGPNPGGGVTLSEPVSHIREALARFREGLHTSDEKLHTSDGEL